MGDLYEASVHLCYGFSSPSSLSLSPECAVLESLTIAVVKLFTNQRALESFLNNYGNGKKWDTITNNWQLAKTWKHMQNHAKYLQIRKYGTPYVSILGHSKRHLISTTSLFFAQGTDGGHPVLRLLILGRPQPSTGWAVRCSKIGQLSTFFFHILVMLRKKKPASYSGSKNSYGSSFMHS